MSSKENFPLCLRCPDPNVDAKDALFLQETKTGPGPKAGVGAAPTKAAAFVLC